MTAGWGSVITVMSDEEHQLNPSNQNHFYLEMSQAQTLSAPFFVATNYTHLEWK